MFACRVRFPVPQPQHLSFQGTFSPQPLDLTSRYAPSGNFYTPPRGPYPLPHPSVSPLDETPFPAALPCPSLLSITNPSCQSYFQVTTSAHVLPPPHPPLHIPRIRMRPLIGSTIPGYSPVLRCPRVPTQPQTIARWPTAVRGPPRPVLLRAPSPPPSIFSRYRRSPGLWFSLANAGCCAWLDSGKTSRRVTWGGIADPARGVVWLECCASTCGRRVASGWWQGGQRGLAERSKGRWRLDWG